MNNQTGFLSNDVNLEDMKEIFVKIILLGDGMSGKTQILLTFGRIILKYLKDLYFKSNISNESSVGSKEISSFDVDFLDWVNSYNFLIEYGDSRWNLSNISLQTETIGIEDFKFKFPYLWNNQTYEVSLKGSDLGGQNIFDHLRAVLGKIAIPDGNMIVVFDKSRYSSCRNSLEHVKDATSGKSLRDEDTIRFWYVGNKSDLEQHINNQNWRDKIINVFFQIMSSNKKYSIPSLLDKKEEIPIYLITNDNRIPFPDLEALLYNAIRTADESYQSPLMSDINAKALAREIAVQLICYQRMKNTQVKYFNEDQWWTQFKSLIFQQRPLAFQYLRGFSAFQPLETYLSLHERVRAKWIGYEATSPIKYEEIQSAFIKAGEGNRILEKMPLYYSTDAIMGIGVLELFSSIISETISAVQNPNFSRKKRLSRNVIKKF
ncbi:MAG: hypothetical protein ACFFFH_18120 [Candidatus Thorarchaeota archaeon]